MEGSIKGTKPSNDRTLKRIKGILRALDRGDITATEALSSIKRVWREEATAEARRSEA